jgi:hypothetical protein
MVLEGLQARFKDVDVSYCQLVGIDDELHAVPLPSWKTFPSLPTFLFWSLFPSSSHV